jgi:hypothetical protein
MLWGTIFRIKNFHMVLGHLARLLETNVRIREMQHDTFLHGE